MSPDLRNEIQAILDAENSSLSVDDTDILSTFPEAVHWGRICYSYDISIEFIEQFKEHIIWRNIEVNRSIHEDTLAHFHSHINWDEATEESYFSENFIREHHQAFGMCWKNICCNKNIELSGDFILEHLQYMVFNDNHEDSLYNREDLKKFKFLKDCNDSEET